MKFVFVVFTLFLLSSCKLSPKVQTVVTTSGTSQKKADTLSVSTNSKAAASVVAAKNALPALPDSLPKTAIETELDVAAANLEIPTPEDLKIAIERVEATLRGDLKAATEARTKALNDAAALKDQLADAKLEAQREREASVLAIQRALADAEKRIEAERLRAEQIIKSRQVLYLNSGAGACLVVFLVCVGFGGLQGLSRGWVFGVAALMGFGLAQIVSQAWFMWACLGSLVLLLAAFALWAFNQYKKQRLTEELKEKAERATAFVKQVVPATDSFVKAVGGEQNDAAKILLAKLSRFMDNDTKALVHETRAKLKA